MKSTSPFFLPDPKTYNYYLLIMIKPITSLVSKLYSNRMDGA